MGKIKGQNFRLKVSGAAVPAETNCQVTMTGNMEDASTKDTEGMYNEEELVSKSWQLQADSYMVDVAGIKALINVFNAAAPVAVGFDQTTGDSGEQNRDFSNSALERSGNALLTDVTFSFNDRATATVSSQYQGTGALS